jgi:hypothetical protein
MEDPDDLLYVVQMDGFLDSLSSSHPPSVEFRVFG